MHPLQSIQMTDPKAQWNGTTEILLDRFKDPLFVSRTVGWSNSQWPS